MRVGRILLQISQDLPVETSEFVKTKSIDSIARFAIERFTC